MASVDDSALTPNPGLAVVLTTAPSTSVASDLARALLSEGLAACVNLIPACQSIYVWKGQLCEESEVLCVIKTQHQHLAALFHRISGLHPYELPEMLAFDAAAASSAYRRWIVDATGGPKGPPTPL